MAQSAAIVSCGKTDVTRLEKAVASAASRHGLAIAVVKTDNPDIVRASDLVILTGDCDFDSGMKELSGGAGFLEALEHVVLVDRKPILGIGCGMMLFAERGPEKKPCSGLGWIPGRVLETDPALTAKVTFPYQQVVSAVSGHSLFAGLDVAEFTFTRSWRFAPENEAHIIARAKDDENKIIAIERDNIAGVLFHPELSGDCGDHLLSNFLHWTPA